MKEHKRSLLRNNAVQSLLASLLCILIGLLVGYVVLLLINPAGAGEAITTIVKNFMTYSRRNAQLKYLGSTLVKTAPLLMCSLSVLFAYKVGLFNIGASGQYTMGAFFALFCGICLQLPWFVCLLAACLGGAIWGFFPGFFKAKFNVNEVLTGILFNWIGMNLVNFLIPNITMQGGMLSTDWGGSASDRTAALADANPAAILPRLGLDKLLRYNYMNIGFFLAILVAILAWVILRKTVFGYELRACGLNRSAAEYAGINAHKNIVLSMVISGAFAGLGGGFYYLAGGGQLNLLQQINSMGFDGISVALLASCNPIACIFSAIFVSYINLGGIAMQSQGYATEATQIVISVIIYLAAFSLLMQSKIAGFFKKSGKKQEKEGAQ